MSSSSFLPKSAAQRVEMIVFLYGFRKFQVSFLAVFSMLVAQSSVSCTGLVPIILCLRNESNSVFKELPVRLSTLLHHSNLLQVVRSSQSVTYKVVAFHILFSIFSMNC